MKKVFVLRDWSGLYWQEGSINVPCWNYLSAKYTKVWKTRAGVERFITKNNFTKDHFTIEEVGENLPRSAWR